MAEEGRVFLRGLSSEEYGLGELRRRQRAVPRVIRGGWDLSGERAGYGDHGDRSTATWLVGPGDDPFLTQTLQSHTVELLPGGWNRGHGHQNEALFYVLEGTGYEIHDGKRYEWKKDDVIVVHNDSVHQHFNASETERAKCLVIKAKATWVFLGLVQQGRGGPKDASGLGPREDWSRLWTPGVTEKKKVVTSADTRWETTRDGRVRVITSPERTDLRARSVDLYQQEVPPRGRSAKHWHMADELVYVMSGRGHSLHWDVEAEIADRYYARVANDPSRWEIQAKEMLYVPQNTVHQHVNDGDEPLLLLVGQNRLFKLLGYDSVVYVEDAAVAEGAKTATA